MTTEEFLEKFKKTYKDWGKVREAHYSKLIKFIDETNPNSPMIYNCINNDWINYKNLISVLGETLSKQFNVNELSLEAKKFLSDFYKELERSFYLERIQLIQHICKRGEEKRDPLPIPTMAEQIDTGEILPDNPALYQVRW